MDAHRPSHAGEGWHRCVRRRANARKYRDYPGDHKNRKYAAVSRGFVAGGPGFEPRLTESESAPTEAVVGVLRRQGLQPDSPCCFCPIVTNMAEYATASGSAEMVTPKNRLAGGEAPLLCRQHGIPQGPARADARRSTGRSPRRVIGTTPLFAMQISYMAASSHQSSSVSASAGEREAPSPMFRPCGQAPPARRNR